MAPNDLSSSLAAPPALAPLELDDLAPQHLVEMGRRIAARTWELGPSRWFWGEGVALLGLGAFGLAAGSGDEERVRAWVDERLRGGLVVEHVNELAPAAAAIAVDPKGELLDALAPLVSWVMSAESAPRSSNGAIEHWPGGVWADTMFMVGAFLSRYGRAAGDVSAVEEAGRQFVSHAELLQDEHTGLFAHGRHCDETLWSFWGRANAWAALAAVEYLEASATLNVDIATRVEVEQRLLRQLTALVRTQPAHGVWEVLVDGKPETAGILETSAAAGIAAAMLRTPRVVNESASSIENAGWKALSGTLAYVESDGVLARVSAGTVLQLIPFGYSVIRSDLPQFWGQGLALLGIEAALTAPRDPRGGVHQ